MVPIQEPCTHEADAQEEDGVALFVAVEPHQCGHTDAQSEQRRRDFEDRVKSLGLAPLSPPRSDGENEKGRPDNQVPDDPATTHRSDLRIPWISHRQIAHGEGTALKGWYDPSLPVASAYRRFRGLEIDRRRDTGTPRLDRMRKLRGINHPPLHPVDLVEEERPSRVPRAPQSRTVFL